jgi:hypothetical protein
VLIPHAQAAQRHTWQEAAGAIGEGPKGEREASTELLDELIAPITLGNMRSLGVRWPFGRLRN